MTEYIINIPVLGEVVNRLLGVSDKLRQALENFINLLSELINFISELIDFITKATTATGEAISEAVSESVSWILNEIRGIIDWIIKASSEEIVSYTRDLIDWLIPWAKQTAVRVFDAGVNSLIVYWWVKNYRVALHAYSDGRISLKGLISRLLILPMASYIFAWILRYLLGTMEAQLTPVTSPPDVTLKPTPPPQLAYTRANVGGLKTSVTYTKIEAVFIEAEASIVTSDEIAGETIAEASVTTGEEIVRETEAEASVTFTETVS